ncbi:hypothetical protein CYL16_25760 [Mycobacterium sp. EPG1]|nr:hypothetical protein CYL16_25760 [Mycobacterium sp. EPG1]
MVVTLRPGAFRGGAETTPGVSAVLRVASCNAIAVPEERPRLGAAIIRRAGPRQVGQVISSGRLCIECICCVTAQPDRQRNA